MKKRHKTIVLIAAGALVYSIGILMGVSLLSGNNSQRVDQNNIATQDPLHEPVANPEILSKWVSEIQPAAGTDKESKTID